MDGQGYYESLLAQGYGPEDAVKYTQQHYPGFGQAPVAPQPEVMPAPQPEVMPAPQPMVASVPQTMVAVPQNSALAGNLAQPVIVVNQSTNTSKGMRIMSGIFGIMMSLALIGYSIVVIGMWDEVSDDIEEDMETLGFFADVNDDVADFHEGIDSFLSTISYFYYAILLFSIVTLVISVMQFFDKPWGTKALLGSTGLLLVLLLATGAYEASSFVDISEDYEEITDEPLGDMPSFFEVNGTMGGYCAGLCFGVYSLLAFFGRPKPLPVQLVMN